MDNTLKRFLQQKVILIDAENDKLNGSKSRKPKLVKSGTFCNNLVSTVQRDEVDFDIDDLESLQDAELNRELLENQFINRETKEEVLKKRFLKKHSLIFGYFLIPSDQLYLRKLKFLRERKERYYYKKLKLD